MPREYTEEEDALLHADILVIGKAMLDAAKALSKESGRPLYDYDQAVIQSLIVVFPLITEGDPAKIRLEERLKEIDTKERKAVRKPRKKKGE